MSFLAQVSTTPPVMGVRGVIAGVEKIGKTTLTTGAPKALLIPLENGFAGVSVPHTPLIQTYNDFVSLLNEIIGQAQQGAFPFRTLVIDSVTALERMIHEATIQEDPTFRPGNAKGLTMESALGGYGKAYSRANEKFESVLRTLDLLAYNAGINVMFTCHVFASKVMDPLNGEYDSWDLLLHSPKNQKTYGKREIFTQWADFVGFLHEPIYVTKSEGVVQGMSKKQGRVLGMSRTPAYTAGNRFGVEGEISIPREQGWNYLADAIYKATQGRTNIFHTA